MAEPSTPAWLSFWTGILAASIAAISAQAITWVQTRKERQNRRSLDNAQVDLAQIARDSHDRDQLLITLRDRIMELTKENTGLREQIEQERDERYKAESAYKARILRLQRLRAIDNVRLINLTGFIIGHGLTPPLVPSIEFSDDDDTPKPKASGME